MPIFSVLNRDSGDIRGVTQNRTPELWERVEKVLKLETCVKNLIPAKRLPNKPCWHMGTSSLGAIFAVN